MLQNALIDESDLFMDDQQVEDIYDTFWINIGYIVIYKKFLISIPHLVG